MSQNIDRMNPECEIIFTAYSNDVLGDEVGDAAGSLERSYDAQSDASQQILRSGASRSARDVEGGHSNTDPSFNSDRDDDEDEFVYSSGGERLFLRSRRRCGGTRGRRRAALSQATFSKGESTSHTEQDCFRPHRRRRRLSTFKREVASDESFPALSTRKSHDTDQDIDGVGMSGI